MRILFKLLRLGLVLGLLGLALGLGAIALAWAIISPRLPDVEVLRDVQLQEPLRIYTADGALISVIGELRRSPVTIDEIPLQVRQAFIAVEDARFYEHPGFDWQGIARAVWLLARQGGGRVPGGSTITQQVARNFFLSSEFDYLRKLTEIFLAVKIERELSKDQILELYLNKIFFGHRAYGIKAAANVYYGKTLDELTLAEAAMLASLPKAPSTRNPITNPTLALQRRNYVLNRMLEVGFIDDAEHAAAIAEPDRARLHEPAIEFDAPWVAELARQRALELLGDAAFTGGFHLYTTVDSRQQRAATDALRRTLADYDQRHGWRGAESRVSLDPEASPHEWAGALSGLRPIAGLVPALVVATAGEHATLVLADAQLIELPLAAMAWARRHEGLNRRGPAPRSVEDVLAVGDVVRLRRDEEHGWTLAQLPEVQGALAAIDAQTGAILAIEGGFSFARSRFNRATQSARQPGSAFKPFVFAAAFEQGLTPATLMLDGPIVHDDASLERAWRPRNDNQRYDGMMRLREAMVRSRNTVSVRVLQATGVGWTREYVSRFGFPLEALPENLSLALGTSAVSPLSMARGYAVFANGGYLVEPFLVARIDDARGQTVYNAVPSPVCGEALDEGLARLPLKFAADAADSAAESAAADMEGYRIASCAPRVIDARNAYLVSSLLRDVVRRGTGRAALSLGRGDLAGKTGTTNEFRDVWFAGYNDRIVAVSWVGFDQFTPLGRGEFASRLALPMWIDFMRVALDGVPERPVVMPEGIITARIDPTSGELVLPGTPGGQPEVFRVEDLQRLVQARPTHSDARSEPDVEIDIF